MGYIIKLFSLLNLLLLQVITGEVTYLELLGLLALISLFIYREKYNNHLAILGVEVGIILGLAQVSPFYLIMVCVTSYDLALKKLFYWIPLLLPVGWFFLELDWFSVYIAFLALSSFSGYLAGQLIEKESSFQVIYDRERGMRFSLEEAKARLMGATKEAAHLAETKERNRIARELHDHIGHSLSGVLLQLQVATKMLDKDEAKAKEMVENSVLRLADSVELLRDTVHNIKPREQLGLAYFLKIIDNFQFCPVDFKHTGDMGSLSPAHVEIISTTLKEALTNAARHSKATKVDISLDIHPRIVRLYFKDNGVGCSIVKEGLGISGMKERVRNFGGNISFGTKDGFMIVCVLPREESIGGAFHEGFGR